MTARRRYENYHEGKCRKNIDGTSFVVFCFWKKGDLSSSGDQEIIRFKNGEPRDDEHDIKRIF